MNIKEITQNNYPILKATDLFVSNSLLHHMHNPLLFWQKVKLLAKPGALIFLRDLRRPNNSEIAFLMQKKYLQNAPKVLVKDYLASLHAAFTVGEVRAQLEKEDLKNFKVTEVDDQYLEVVGVF